MKILLATYWTLPHVGGLSSYVYTLKDELQKAGIEVDLFGQHPSYRSYHFPEKQIEIPKNMLINIVQQELDRAYVTDHMDAWVHFMELERYCFELAAATIDFSQYDIVHVQDVVSARAMSRILPDHVHLVATIHGWFTKEFILKNVIQEKGRSAEYSKFQEYVGLVSADALIFPSNWLKNMLAYDTQTKRYVIPYGVKTASFTRKMPFHQQKKHHIIACVARLEAYKGIQDLIMSLAKLAMHRDDWECWLIGDGPIRNELEKTVTNLQLGDHVRFWGKRNDVPELLAQADIFVLPSHIDNFPFAVLEAQLSGLPVIVSNAGGIPEIVEHQQTGLIFSVGDTDQLLLHIQTLLNHPDLRRRMGEMGKKRSLKTYRVESNVLSTINIYEEIGKQEQVRRLKMKGKKESFRKEKHEKHTHAMLKSVEKKCFTVEQDTLSKEKIQEIWTNIFSTLPPDYTIPDPLLLKKINELMRESDQG